MINSSITRVGIVLSIVAIGTFLFRSPTFEKSQVTASSDTPIRITKEPEVSGFSLANLKALALANAPVAVVEERAQVSSSLMSVTTPVDIPQRSPDVVLQTLVDEPLTGDSETELLQTLQGWSENSVEDAVVWIEATLNTSAPGSAAFALRHSLLSLWLEIEPATALTRLDTLSDPEEIPYFVADHAVRMADLHTPEYALQWAELSLDGSVRTRAIDGVLDHWLTRDADSLATELLYQVDLENQTLSNTHQASDRLNHVGVRLVNALAKNDPEQALKLAQRLNSDKAEAAQERVVVEWLVEDPSMALQWVENVITDTGTLPSAVAAAIPAGNIDVAITTVNTLEGTARDAMTVAIVDTLSETDPYAARAWIDGLYEPDLRDRATRSWIVANASRMPTEALDAALASPQSASWPELLIDTASIVVQNHPQLLHDWLASASIASSDQADIRALLF